MAARIAQITAGDSTREVARKVVLHGGKASHTAVQKWLSGGEMDEENVTALAAAYGSTPAFIRYGVGPAEALTDKQRAAADLVANDPPAWVQQGFDFMRYQLEKSPLTDNGPKGAASYLRLLAKLVERKKE